MREHGNEAGEIDEVRHCLCFAAIDVDGVAERLEGVETDAERQDDAEESIELGVLQSEAGGERIPTFDAEVEILEEAERGEIQENRNPDRVALRAAARSAPGQRLHRLAQNAPEFPGVVRDNQAHEPIDER